ncbi:MAG: isoprenylcysteine carboxylmethyltransferase family protein [Gammaproteobacteria bacterium]|nr:isoprenylcysteine carboxylmethyltransferase family protein [Gammaproteobacteria bacterium]
MKIIRLPILMVALLSLLMTLTARLVTLQGFTFESQFVVAAVLFLFGLIVIAVSALSFIRAQTTVNPLTPQESSALVTSGSYQFSRNPMYIGFFTWLLSVFVILANWINILFLIAFVFLANAFYIKPEEQALKTIFGSAYDDYCQRVRRWL